MDRGYYYCYPIPLDNKFIIVKYNKYAFNKVVDDFESYIINNCFSPTKTELLKIFDKFPEVKNGVISGMLYEI